MKKATFPPARLESGEELSGDGTDGEWIGGDRREPRRVGRIGDDADDGNVLPRRLADVRLECRGVARRDDQAVGAVAAGPPRRAGVTLAETRIASEIHVQRRTRRAPRPGGCPRGGCPRRARSRAADGRICEAACAISGNGRQGSDGSRAIRAVLSTRARVMRVDARLRMQCAVDGAG